MRARTRIEPEKQALLLRAGDFMPGFFSRLLWSCMISEFDRGTAWAIYRRGGANGVGLSEFRPHLAKVQVVAEVRRERDVFM